MFFEILGDFIVLYQVYKKVVSYEYSYESYKILAALAVGLHNINLIPTVVAVKPNII